MSDFSHMVYGQVYIIIKVENVSVVVFTKGLLQYSHQKWSNKYKKI